MNTGEPHNVTSFSILIPTWNRCDLLKEAIQSIINQSFTDFEIIISDNCSTDNTRGVVEQFKDNRIKYFLQQNHISATDNYNYAYSKSSGDYVILIGDDDYLLPSVLQKVYNVIKDQSAQVISGGIVWYYSKDYFEPCMQNTMQCNIRKSTHNVMQIPSKRCLYIHP